MSDAVGHGDRSAVMTVEELIRELDALDDAKDPEPSQGSRTLALSLTLTFLPANQVVRCPFLLALRI